MSKHESLRSNKLKRAALAVLVGATSLTGCAPKAEVPTPAPSASEPSNPGEQTPAPTEATPSATPSVSESPAPSAEVTKTREQLITELEIEAGQPPEEFAEAYLDRLELQILAGGSEEYYKKLWGDPSIGIDEIEAENRAVAEAQSEIFTQALYVENWQDYETLVNVKEYMTALNAMHLYTDAANFMQGSGRYQVNLELVRAVVSSEASASERTMVLDFIEHNNASELMSDPKNAAAADGKESQITISTIVIGGKEKATYIDSASQ